MAESVVISRYSIKSHPVCTYPVGGGGGGVGVGLLKQYIGMGKPLRV